VRIRVKLRRDWRERSKPGDFTIVYDSSEIGEGVDSIREMVGTRRLELLTPAVSIFLS
jgi:hypothetical protein